MTGSVALGRRLPPAWVVPAQRVGHRPVGVHTDDLMARGFAVAQGQDDRAHHGDQQDQPGCLEQENVVGVEDAAESLGVADGRGRGRHAERTAIGRQLPAAQHRRQFQEQHDADGRADRQVALEAAAQLREIHVEHHHDEQEQHGDRADVDDDQNHGQELGPGDQEQGGSVEERQDQEQHRMDRVAGADNHRGRDQEDGGEQVEKKRGDHR